MILFLVRVKLEVAKSVLNVFHQNALISDNLSTSQHAEHAEARFNLPGVVHAATGRLHVHLEVTRDCFFAPDLGSGKSKRECLWGGLLWGGCIFGYVGYGAK